MNKWFLNQPQRRLISETGVDPYRPNITAVGLFLFSALISGLAGPAWAASATGGGVARSEDGPTLTDPLHLSGRRASAWSSGPDRVLLLERDVVIRLGSYGFRADQALVYIETDVVVSGRPICRAWIYLDNARPLSRLSPVQAQAPRLIVTASTSGPVRLSTDLMRNLDRPADHVLVREGIRIQRHPTLAVGRQVDLPLGRRGAAASPSFVSDDPKEVEADPIPEAEQITSSSAPTPKAPVEPVPEPTTDDPSPTHDEAVLADTTEVSPEENKNVDPEPMAALPIQGTVSFYAEKIILREHTDDEAALLLTGSVRVVYQDARREEALILSAGNGVIFLGHEGTSKLLERETDASAVRGVYLEDSVVLKNGPYTVRAPRVYYDPPLDKAVVLDAVLYTWDAKRKIPIYVRADTLRQASRSSWSADNAALTTSEFAVPHFSIAAGRITIDQPSQEAGADARATRFSAQGATLKWGAVPVFYWPKLSGQAAQAERLPFSQVNAGYSRRNGLEVRTTWDLFSLTDREAPEGVELQGRLDQIGEHGPALGIDLAYDQTYMFGELDSYLILHDTGDDEIGNRRDVEFDGDTRGQILWRHRQYLRNSWELTLELAHVSDETFLEAFDRERAELDKGYETSLYLVKREGDRAFSFLAQYDLLGFTAQTPALQSPGYRVDKLPELGFFKIGTDLWDQRLTYFGETRLSRMHIRVGEDKPEDRGFTTRQSAALFGIPDTTNFDDAASAIGLPNDYVLRIDSRHEVQAPMKVGSVDLVPFATGRITAYDDDFSEFSGNDDRLRLWGAAGLRAHTQLSRTFDDVDDDVLDLHRLRHVIEPEVEVFWAGSTLDPDDLPVFDGDVEPLSEGWGVKLGTTQTLQTQRGGEGRWQTVDWIVADTHFVFRGDDADTATEPAWFFGYRPEHSRGGDHFQSDLAWRLSDTFATVGQVTHSLESDSTSQWRIGGSLRHAPDLTSSFDYADIDPLSSRLLSYGFTYRLTRKYDLAFRHRLDMARNESRRLELTVHRKLPRWRLIFTASHDDVDDEQVVGVVLVPEGLAPSDPHEAFGSSTGW